MAYVSFVSDKPNIADVGGTVIQNTRENLMALRDAIVCGQLKGFNMSVSGGTAEEPTEILFKKSTEWIRATITWGTTGGEDGQPKVIVYAYSANSGGVYDTIGTLTMAYDSSFNMTTQTWS